MLESQQQKVFSAVLLSQLSEVILDWEEEESGGGVIMGGIWTSSFLFYQAGFVDFRLLSLSFLLASSFWLWLGGGGSGGGVGQKQ